jgi:hypothetical protein
MRKLSSLAKGGLMTAAAVAATVGLAASPASAAGTWTVSGSTGSGGAFTASATKPVLKDANTGTTLTCASSAATGTAPNGTGLSGTNIAAINTVTFASCTGPAGISFTVASQSLPWHLNAVSYSGGVTTGTLTGVRAKLTGLCNATFAAPSGVNNGATLTGSYNNATHTLSISGASALKAYSVSGICVGLINNNDLASFTAAYVVSPSTLKITSP